MKKRTCNFLWTITGLVVLIIILCISKNLLEKHQQKECVKIVLEKQPSDSVTKTGVHDLNIDQTDTSVTKLKIMIGMIEIPDTKNPIKGIRMVYPEVTASDIVEIFDMWNPRYDPSTHMLESKLLMLRDINIPRDWDLIIALKKEYPNLYEDDNAVSALLLSSECRDEIPLIDRKSKMKLIGKISKEIRVRISNNERISSLIIEYDSLKAKK